MVTSNVVLHRRTFGKTFIAGELFVNGKRICATLEYPWRGNVVWDSKQNKSWNFFHTSCVHEGIYDAQIRTDGVLGFRLELLGTSQRQFIEFHVGNSLIRNSEGCILAGEFHGGILTGIEPKLSGGSSTLAIKRFKEALLPDASKVKNPFDWAKMMSETEITARIIGMPPNYWLTGK